MHSPSQQLLVCTIKSIREPILNQGEICYDVTLLYFLFDLLLYIQLYSSTINNMKHFIWLGK